MKSKFMPIIIATIIIALITVATRIWHLDLLVSGAFYTPGQGFVLSNNLIVSFFYYSISFMVAISILCFLAYPVIYWRFTASRKYWRIVLALFIALAVGPGIIVNSIFKDHFGRPRPAQTTEFGGQMEFKPVLEANWGQPGKSFPSGHASVPLAYLLLAFAAYRRKRHTLAKRLGVGIVFWYVMVGYARIAAGGHHFSDVVWAGYIAFVSAWLSYLYIESKGKSSSE